MRIGHYPDRAASRAGLFLAVLGLVTLGACQNPTASPDGGTPAAGGAEPTVVSRGGSASSADDASGNRPRVFDSPALAALRTPEYAIQAFLWWRPEVAERDLLAVKDIGFTWIKQGIGWRDVELEKGKFDWEHTDHFINKAQEYGGLKLIARVDNQPNWAREGCSLQGPPEDLQDYADFLTALATRYRGKIAAYQIWNEPNLAREWCDQPPDPVAYAEMLRVAYAAIKKADPDALVISAGFAPTGTEPPTAMPDDAFLDALYEAIGGSGDGYFDLLGVHAPGYAAPPETSPEEAAASEAYGGERYFTFRRVEDLRKIVEQHGDSKRRLAVLEMGWTSDEVNPDYAWHAVTEAQKADYLVRAYQYAGQNWSPWMTIMSTIYMCNADWTPADEQYWWCINEPDGTPRPAYDALKAMPKVQQ